MTRITTLFLILAGAALLVAGCGGGGDATAASSSSMGSSNTGATIRVSDNGKLGKILVDSKGRTVYLFKKDTGSKSTCSGACAFDWPPVTTTGKPTAGTGATASMLGTTRRSDGAPQVTYNGHPLYLYIGDRNTGDANGQSVNAFGAEWYVLTPAGSANTAGGSAAGQRYSY
jgi:predicted lipoprotein with Yx(FWY)xxD motif